MPPKRDKDRRPSQEMKVDLETGAPVMSPPLALVFAKLLHVGCPPVRAVLYCAPRLDKDTAQKVSRLWLNDAEVLRAVEGLNGGAWAELPPEKRYELAYNKHLSEHAFYLWVTNWNDVEHNEGINKMKISREVLRAELGKVPDDADAMQAFARFALDMVRHQAEADSKKRQMPKPRNPFEHMGENRDALAAMNRKKDDGILPS